jgi:phage terminase large subunit-like protein
MYLPHTDSTLTVLPAEPGALQGWNPSLAIVDELHVVTRPVWDSVALAAGKRASSLVLAISTCGPARQGVMWELVEHGRRGDDPSFVLAEYAAPEDCTVDDEAAWAVANPALGDFLYADALRSTLRTTREADFRRYRLGQWTQHADAWLPREAWAACAAARGIPDGADVVLGFDGSYSGDATAIVAVQCGDVPHVEVVRRGNHPRAFPAGRCRSSTSRTSYATHAKGGGSRRSSPTRSAGRGHCSCSPSKGCPSRSARRARPG